jgi:hypothetical protein
MTRKTLFPFLLPAALLALAALPAAAGGPPDVRSGRPAPKHDPPNLQLLGSLASEVSREAQLADLNKDPAGAAALSKALKELALKPIPAPSPNDPWAKGIGVSPLSPIWPVGAVWAQAGVYLSSYNAYFDPWHPLPTAGKDTLTMVVVNDPTDAFVTLSFRWPKAGYYLVSVNAVSEYPTAARPRFGLAGVPGATLATMAPNDPANPARWTALVNVPPAEVSQAMVAYGFFPSNPDKLGGFIEAFVGKVTIRKL